MSIKEREYTGLVIGGPKDGFLMASRSSILKVSIMGRMRPLINMREADEAALMEKAEVFTYELVRLYGQFFFWVPEAVCHKEAYEGRFFEHPNEYILLKLAHGYATRDYPMPL